MKKYGKMKLILCHKCQDVGDPIKNKADEVLKESFGFKDTEKC